MTELKEFNALVGLAGFDPEESKPFVSAKNALKAGVTTVFRDLGTFGNWGKDSKNEDKKFPMVITDYGVECNSAYVGACMVATAEDNIKLNMTLQKELHCMHSPRSAKEAGVVGYDFLKKHVDKTTGAFPRINVIETLPIAIRRQDLIDHAYDDTKKLYLQILKVRLEDLDCEYVPHYRKSTKDANIFSIKSSIVALA